MNQDISKEGDQYKGLQRNSFVKAGILVGSLLTPLSLEAADPPDPTQSQEVQSQTVHIEHYVEKGLSYFNDARHASGLIYDRMPNEENAPIVSSNPRAASLAATGYGLASLPLLVERDMLTREDARSIFKKTLDTADILSEKTKGGWLHHFVNPETLEPSLQSEVSSIDTTLFYYGALIVAEYFEGRERDRVYTMIERLDFDLMLTRDGTRANHNTFSHGYHLDTETQELSFIRSEWDRYSEGVLLAFLALSDEDISADVWTKGIDMRERWSNDSDSTFDNLPLFTYYYPLGLIPCKDQVDAHGINYWIESATAVDLQKEYCEDKQYPEALFGLSACDGPDGYHAYAAHDGFKHKVIAPPAVLASLPYAEDDTLEALAILKRLHLMEGRYGMVAAFDVESGWTAPDMLGIDIGSTLLMLDRYQDGLIHSLLLKSPLIQRSMKRAGFHVPQDTSPPAT